MKMNETKTKRVAAWREANPEKFAEWLKEKMQGKANRKWREANSKMVTDWRKAEAEKSPEQKKAEAEKLRAWERAEAERWAREKTEKAFPGKIAFEKAERERIIALEQRKVIIKWRKANPEKAKVALKNSGKNMCRWGPPIFLNDPFEGSAGHHMEKQKVIYIPIQLHLSVGHYLEEGINMVKINGLAMAWYEGLI